MVAGTSSSERLFDPAAEGREEQRGVEALLVHRREARVAVAVAGGDRLDLRISVRGSTPSGIWPRNCTSRQPGTMTGSNVGFGMNRLSFPPMRISTCVPSCTTAHPALLERAVEVARERVERLVVMVVGIDGSQCVGHARNTNPGGCGMAEPQEAAAKPRYAMPVTQTCGLYLTPKASAMSAILWHSDSRPRRRCRAGRCPSPAHDEVAEAPARELVFAAGNRHVERRVTST